MYAANVIERTVSESGMYRYVRVHLKLNSKHWTSAVDAAKALDLLGRLLKQFLWTDVKTQHITIALQQTRSQSHTRLDTITRSIANNSAQLLLFSRCRCEPSQHTTALNDMTQKQRFIVASQNTVTFPPLSP